MRNHALSEYFFCTRLERNACNVLIALCLICFVLPATFPFFMGNQDEIDFTEIQHIAASLMAPDIAGAKPVTANVRYPGPDAPETELFAFDPNTATKEDFVRLGLSSRAAQTILNYRAKGGKFFKKEDFGKIYSIRAEDYALLAPWIQIRPAEPRWKDAGKKPESETFAWASDAGGEPRPTFFSPKEKTPVAIDINRATAEDWQQLQGIGPGYSKRIVNFREKLGGFASVEQVGETFGLPDSTFQQILPSLQLSPVFRRIHVNTVTLEELKAHPYLSSFQATVVFNYRKQHGAFADMEGLKKVKAGFTDSDWERLEAYLAFD